MDTLTYIDEQRMHLVRLVEATVIWAFDVCVWRKDPFLALGLTTATVAMVTHKASELKGLT